MQHPEVSEAVVVAREDGRGRQAAGGYVVAATQACSARTQASCARIAMTRLPDYMVPSAFVRLEALPLLPNGKVDRNALPAPGAAAYAQRDYVAPRNATEEVLAGIWSEVLKLDRVGVHDNFFDLGGHSLLAMRVVARIRDAFQLELPLRALFEAPSAGRAGRADRCGAARPGAGRRAVACGAAAWRQRCHCRLRRSGCGSGADRGGWDRPTTCRRRFGCRAI